MSESSKQWRRDHPDRHRAQQKRYYNQVPDAPRSGLPWAEADLRRIIDPDRPCDAELARELGRSMEAIQVTRSKLRSGEMRADRIEPDTRRYGALSGHRADAPTVVPAAILCSRCGLTHPGEC